MPKINHNDNVDVDDIAPIDDDIYMDNNHEYLPHSLNIISNVIII